MRTKWLARLAIRDSIMYVQLPLSLLAGTLPVAKL